MTAMTKIRKADFTPDDWDRFERMGLVDRWRQQGTLDETAGRTPTIGPSWATVSLAAAGNPYHEPGGSPVGGRFAHAPGGAGGGAPTKDALAYELLGDYPDTQAKYAGPVQGYTQERVTTVQNPIIARAVAEGTPGQATPTTLFLAGGSGSGKTTILGQLDATMRPDGAIMVNPDAVKESIPEYRQMVEGGSKYAALGTHEESSDVSKRILGEAVAGNYNAIVDGTGDSGTGKFMAKIDAQKALGRDVKIVMADIPTEEAVTRARLRAENPASDSYGRFVDPAEIRKIHRSVAQNHLIWRDQVDNWEVYSNDQGPKLVARRVNGGPIEVLDAKRYQQALDKAKE